MTDIEAIRARHNDLVASHPCSPTHCDTAVVLAALDACMKLRSERHRNADICTLEKRMLEADADRLAEALRDAALVAHETDSLRSHSDDERKDGWFRAPFERCDDAVCLDARAALAAHDAIKGRPMTLQRKGTIPGLVVAHFPPFDTVCITTQPKTDGLCNCTTCLGFGCNDCCHTGRADIPPDTAPDMSHTLDTPERDVSQEWDIMIRRASNGFIVRGWSWDGDACVDSLIEDDPTDSAPLRLLWEVIERLGLGGSRHDAKRIFVGYRAGDKHHDYHPRPCAECECGCEPDQSTQEDAA